MAWPGHAWIDPPRAAASPGSHYSPDPDITAEDSANAAKLPGEGFIAVPSSDWTEGQHILIGSFRFTWKGTSWAPGVHGVTRRRKRS